MGEGPAWDFRIIINPQDWLLISFERGLKFWAWCIKRPFRIARTDWADYGYAPASSEEPTE